MEIQTEEEERHTDMVMCTSKGTVTWVSIEFVEKEERKQKGVHAARATQIDIQVEKKVYTHDTDSKQANRAGMCMRENEAIIGKAPRLGIIRVTLSATQQSSRAEASLRRT